MTYVKNAMLIQDNPDSSLALLLSMSLGEKEKVLKWAQS